MGLSRLDNFLKSTRGTILYVDPNALDSTDAIENQGNSLARPFKTVQRALIEAARFSYQRGLDNDRFNKTTIILYPGEHIIDNLYYVNPKQHLFGTHAYVINNKNIDKIIDNIKIIKRPIDVAIQDLSNNRIFTTIIMYPYTVIQNKSFKSTVANKSDVI